MKKVVGFDIFDNEELLNSLQYEDKKMMGNLFSQRKFNFGSDFVKALTKNIESAGFHNNYDFELIKGDSYENIARIITRSDVDNNNNTQAD